MSTNISVSNPEQKNCENILKMFRLLGEDCRVIETTSLVDNKIEKGCFITMGTFENKKKLKYIWENIKKTGNYKCAHLKIDGLFSGCIYNYLNADFCNK
jgi:hypothetical protein